MDEGGEEGLGLKSAYQKDRQTGFEKSQPLKSIFRWFKRDMKIGQICSTEPLQNKNIFTKKIYYSCLFLGKHTGH